MAAAMATSPPTSPADKPRRPASAMIRPQSRISATSNKIGGSRASDDDSRTSVKVAVRVRPPLQPSDPGYDLIPQRFQRSMVQVTSPTGLSVDSPQGRKLFVFDRVFGPEMQQDGVWEYISESIPSFVQGYNVSVLAYGQSGSGKSYSMGTTGPNEQANKKLMGVVPRAAAALFEQLGMSTPTISRNGSGIKTPNRYSVGSFQSMPSISQQASSKSWQLTATYVEIYNEALRDLLVQEHIPLAERSVPTIREDKGGKILLTGLTQVPINSVDDLMNALNFGSTIRQTDSTAINAKSSRSHAVFSLNLVQRRAKEQVTPIREKRMSMPIDSMIAASESWVTTDSKLHFVDLAGSERLKNTGASGDRAKEGISINAGLASLGKVISQLSSRSAGSHVSYRDSKLTRLLQDSLGGNAITYMIACVTPAEFHLSETLNTIQYAQRARAIQSKPQIQQVMSETDKQALIDRLRAEIAFLREQIRSSERGDRVNGAPSERLELQHEREVELQTHLLDVQENYNTLSQRHAKLISEISRAQGSDAGTTPTLTGAIGGESAVERLKRSNSFADAVEQVVLEYEKTIQTLESSLTNTRSSLSTTESALLERETKIAYTDTLNQQLQTRIHKLIDREASTERYLHELEAKLDGRSAGEAQLSTLQADLRREINRLRENESTSEEYISTLEERLAEADQDMELMQREIARLEHVVERQRSLGKLDSLLHEMEQAQTAGPQLDKETSSLTNGVPKTPTVDVSKAIHDVAVATPIPESEEEDGERTASASPGLDNYQPSPAQSKFVAEKLEAVNQELFDLRVEHENTVNDYDLLAAKYEEALRTLAEMQDSYEESSQAQAQSNVNHVTPSFFGSAGMETQNAGQDPSSRSLSSELSSAAVPIIAGASLLAAKNTNAMVGSSTREINGEHDFESMKAMHSQNAEDMSMLQAKYHELQEQHANTLDMVEDLKAELNKSMLGVPGSPNSGGFVRRKSSQNVLNIDRAHRSLASLGNIGAEHLDDKPDVKESFEMNLAAVMHDFHERAERQQSLEAELANLKKEMETKTAIISGLTRERSSLKTSSPVDMTVMASMRDQIVQHEVQLKMMHEGAAAREAQLMKEIDSLTEQLATAKQVPAVDNAPASPLAAAAASHMSIAKSATANHALANKVTALEQELAQIEGKHASVVGSMKASEQKMLETITDLQNALVEVDNLHQQKESDLNEKTRNISAASAAFESERAMHADRVATLSKEIEEHKSTIEGHKGKITELEQSHASAQAVIQEGKEFKESTQKSLNMHRNQIADLERQLMEHQSAVDLYKHGLKSLHDSHQRDVEEARQSAVRDVKGDTDSRVVELSGQHAAELGKHQQTIDSLQQDLQEHKEAIDQHKMALHERDAKVEELQQNINAYGSAKRESSADLREVNTKLRIAQESKAQAEAELAALRSKVEELNWAKTELSDELEDLKAKEQRASRLVEELEGQLTTTFEDTRSVNNRLSVMQTSKDSELMDARAATAKLQAELEVLNNRLKQAEAQRGSIGALSDVGMVERTNSMTSNLRKSASIASLPSPPPVIPLPPLPNMPSSPGPNTASFPHSDLSDRHAREAAQLTQRAEEQEARIRTIEKHLFAEKQLTATLEEALVDLETQGNKVKSEVESWKKKAWGYEDELSVLRKERNANRHSLQAVEEERSARREAEAARQHLEERMAQISRKKGKRGTLNCF